MEYLTSPFSIICLSLLTCSLVNKSNAVMPLIFIAYTVDCSRVSRAVPNGYRPAGLSHLFLFLNSDKSEIRARQKILRTFLIIASTKATSIYVLCSNLPSFSSCPVVGHASVCWIWKPFLVSSRSFRAFSLPYCPFFSGSSCPCTSCHSLVD